MFTFNPEFSVGSAYFDEQHQKLFALMNGIYDLSKRRAPKADIMRAFRDLYVFSMQHFADEEASMKRAKMDPDYIVNHCKAHEELLKRMSDILNEYSTGKTNILPARTMSTFSSWLQKHILGTDKKFAGKWPTPTPAPAAAEPAQK